jgi:ankyrin repeat protein
VGSRSRQLTRNSAQLTALLHRAVQTDSYRHAQVLLDDGADVNATDAKVWTAVHIALERSSTPDSIIEMLRAHPDVNEFERRALELKLMGEL